MSLLRVDNIDVSYGSVSALRGISLHVEEGEIVSILGSNGAGKTTTLRTISGLLTPNSGTVEFEGEDISGLPAHKVVARGLAHLPEGRDLFPTLTVEENLRFGWWTKRSDPKVFERGRERAFEMFPKLAERREQAAGTMSGGEQQMLGVARALMCEPKLLIVDELSLGLAPLIVQQLFEILQKVNSEGTSLLIVEQFVGMALENSDRAYVLAKGEVAVEGDSKRLLNDPEVIAAYLGEAASA